MIYKLRSLTNCPASSQACSSHSFMKKAVIYARYSSDSQSEQSIDGQLRVCKEYAERENIKIVDTYIDRAMTGTNDLLIIVITFYDNLIKIFSNN